MVNDENPTTTIVRRGQPFSGVVRFNRPYDEANDIVQLVFSIGKELKRISIKWFNLLKNYLPMLISIYGQIMK